MKIIRLNKFPNDTLIDEIIVENCNLTIMKIGKAKYKISLEDLDDYHEIKLWTTQKGKIETLIENNFQNKIEVKYDSKENLEKLICIKCILHIEHMDKGHYWLKISSKEGDDITINFITRGYLKTHLEN